MVKSFAEKWWHWKLKGTTFWKLTDDRAPLTSWLSLRRALCWYLVSRLNDSQDVKGARSSRELKAEKRRLAKETPEQTMLHRQKSLDRHLTHDSFGPSGPTMQTAPWSVQPFLQRWPQTVLILYNGSPLFPQNCSFPWGIWTPSDTSFLGGSWAYPSLRSLPPFLQGSLVWLWQTDRQTDSPRYSVGNN